jgi:hypothetical protein
MLLALVLSSGCVTLTGDCTYDTTLAQVKALSDAELLALYAVVQALPVGERSRNTALTPSLEAKYVRRRDGVATAMLGGCFDDKLMMQLDGFPTPTKPVATPSITLTWGDWGHQPQPAATLYP